MKNIFKLKAIRRIAGIIALVTVIGFSMAACDDESGDDTDGEPDTGRLLLTDIPEKYNGAYIQFPLLKTAGGLRLVAFQSYDAMTSTTTYVKISNGKANMPIWIQDGYLIEKYYGNDTASFIENATFGKIVFIYKEPTNQEVKYTELARATFPADPIVFVNGFAEKSVKDIYWDNFWADE